MADVSALVAAAADDHGGRPAIVEPDGRSVTWGELDRMVTAAAARLRRNGIDAGDPVAVGLPNGIDFAVAFWGVLRAGGTVVPVNPEYTAPEIAYMLDDAAVRLVLADDAVAGRIDAAVDVRVFDASELEADASARTATAEADRPDVAVVCYTSGTTGRPKGALLTADNLLANLDSFSELPLLTLTADDVMLGVLPFFHVFGMNVVLNAAARSGAAVLAVRRFSPSTTATAAAEAGVSVLYGAPPVFAALAALDDRPLPSMRAAVSGADALAVAVWERFADRYGVEIVEGYGLTEASPVVASNAAGARARPGTVGPALPGVDVRLLDPGGNDVDVGEVGEVTVRGPNVFAGYHGQPQASAAVLRDGWLATGDLGSRDRDGYLTIAGRLKDLIIVNGFNVYPREVEDALRTHPDVADATVVGIPDPRTGERVRAVVVPRPGAGLTADGLVDHCRDRLARYKLPRDVELLPELPRLPTGKVDRRALRG